MSRTIEAVTAQRVAPPTAWLAALPVRKLVAEWQTGLETVNGHSQWKLRLALSDAGYRGKSRLNGD